MVMITGQKGILNRKQARFQVVDIVATMTPLTKMARQIVGASNIPSIVRDAFRLAQQERPGPVHLELPEDIAAERVFARNYRTRVANALPLDNALATMGAGLPAAMMAAMLHPGRRVLAVCGDGGFLMNAQEMETAVRLGMTFENPDFPAFAIAHGAKGSRVTTADGLAPALEAAFREGGVQLVAAPIDYSENIRVLMDELRSVAPHP
jgi:thiamine pyrophosphate-dependent acetolactate synthase large subunit-like protein